MFLPVQYQVQCPAPSADSLRSRQPARVIIPEIGKSNCHLSLMSLRKAEQEGDVTGHRVDSTNYSVFVFFSIISIAIVNPILHYIT